MDIERIVIETQESAVRIISKEGPLHNPADRDHCLQYMIAIGLIFGELTAEHYEDEIASNPQIAILRKQMHVIENKLFSQDYIDPDKRAIGNAIQIFFKDGTSTARIQVDYPIGHRRRRAEGMPVLMDKFKQSLFAHFSEEQANKILTNCLQEVP